MCFCIPPMTWNWRIELQQWWVKIGWSQVSRNSPYQSSSLCGFFFGDRERSEEQHFAAATAGGACRNRDLRDSPELRVLALGPCLSALTVQELLLLVWSSSTRWDSSSLRSFWLCLSGVRSWWGYSAYASTSGPCLRSPEPKWSQLQTLAGRRTLRRSRRRSTRGVILRVIMISWTSTAGSALMAFVTEEL